MTDQRPGERAGAAVNGTICLTDDEAAALREVLAMLATIGERGFLHDRQLCEVSWQLWNDMLLRPAQRLRRVTNTRRIEATR